MTPEQTLDWLAEQHKSQCNEDRPVQTWIRSMKSVLPAPVQEPSELTRLQHNNEVLMNALWKACGDDEEVVNATIESQGELK